MNEDDYWYGWGDGYNEGCRDMRKDLIKIIRDSLKEMELHDIP